MRIKRLISVIVAVCMILAMMPGGTVFADTGSTTTTVANINYDYDTETKTATVTGHGSISGEIAIPEKITVDGVEYTVTAIGGYAFQTYKAITGISIPDSVTAVGDWAFWDCDGLKTVCFENNSKVSSIGNYTFAGCDSLTDITIPAEVTAIGNWAFWACDRLENVSFEEGCKAGSIGNGAFEECTSLKSITLPKSITHMGNSSFEKCSSLVSVIFEEGSMLEIISESAFWECRSLKSMHIPNCVTTVHDYAFSGCTVLEKVTIGSAVTDIGTGVFGDCPALAEISVAEGNTAYVSDGGVLMNKDKTEIIRYPAAKSGNSYIVPDTATEIRSEAFEDSINLEEIRLPGGITGIGSYAFRNCSSLKSITIPAGVTYILDNTFKNCRSLTSVTFEAGSKVETIGENAFRKCSSLAGIKIPAGVTLIDESAFEDCSGLVSVSFEEGSLLNEIEEDAFDSCSSLESFEIPTGVMRIDSDAFDSNTPGLCFIYAGTGDEWKQKQFPEEINKKRIQYINVKPVLKDRAYSSISLEEINGAEYRIDGGSWQDTPVFTGLSSGTEYTFEVRYKAEEGYAASEPVSAKFSTRRYALPSEPAIDITGKEGGSVIYDRIRHTVTVTPDEKHLIKEILLNGDSVTVTDGVMVLENIYGWSRISVIFEKKQEPAGDNAELIAGVNGTKVYIRSKTHGKGKIKLSWSKSKGYRVDYYQVYRAVKKNGKYKVVYKSATGSKKTYTDSKSLKKGKKYYYKVRGVRIIDGKKYYTGYSKTVGRTVK